MNYEQLVSLMQAQQQVMWQIWFGYLLLAGAGLLIHGFIVYMFYARLRDIADELRKFRVAFEFAEDREAGRTAKVARAEKESGA